MSGLRTVLVAFASGCIGGVVSIWLTSADAVFAGPGSSGPTDATSELVVAREFRLVDRAGTTRGGMAVEGENTVWWIGSKSKGTAVEARAEHHAAHLRLSDATGTTRVAAAVFHELSALTLFDQAGMERISTFAGSQGPAMGLYDRVGKLRVSVREMPDNALFALYDAQNRMRLLASVDALGAALTLSDQAGRRRTTVGATGDSIENGQEHQLFPESTVTLYRPDASVSWRAP